MLRQFVTWRAMSSEWRTQDYQMALESRGQPVLGTVSAVSQGTAQGAASPQHKPERAKSEPQLSPPKEIDLSTQIMQEVQEGTATNYFLQDRKARKQREALEVARTKQQPVPLTTSQAQEELENEAKRLERFQQAVETIKQTEHERAKSGGVAPHMSV